MSLLYARVRQFVPGVSVRFKWHWNRKHRHVKHQERRIFEAITQPIYPHQLNPQLKKIKYCDVLRNEMKQVSAEEENEYAQFLLRRIAEVFENHKMVIAFHVLSIKMHERKEQNLILQREGFGIRAFPNDLIRQYVEQSIYRNIAPLLSQRNMYVVSAEPRVAELVQLIKHTPDFVMLGGIVHDRILTRAGLEHYAALGPSEDLLAETVAILNLGAQKLSSSLQSHQQTLVTNLSQYVKDRGGNDGSES